MFLIMLLGWFVRASILLAIGWLVARWIERRSATVAHRMLVIAFAGCLLIPIAMAWSPTWQWHSPAWLGVTPTPSSIQTVAVVKPDIQTAKDESPRRQEVTDSSPMANTPQALVAETSHAISVPSMDAAQMQVALPTVTNENLATSVELERSSLASDVVLSLSWGNWLIIVWLVGTTVLILRLLFSIAVLGRYLSVCGKAPLALTDQAKDAARQLGVKQSAHIGLSRQDSMPMSGWLGQWMIVLPSNFADWPEEHRDATLAHEFGHLARRDAWADYLVQFALCFLWLNPLAWWAATDLRRLRERACDEWVLKRSDLSPVRYAKSLLAVVGICHDQRLKFASPMGRRCELETRLNWLVSASERRVIRPVVEIAILLLVSVAGVAIATGQPVAALAEADLGLEQTPEVTLSLDPSPTSPAINVGGKVVDDSGKPLAGMNVVLRGQVRNTHQYCNGLGHVRDVLATTKTDSQGRFNFAEVGIPPRMIEVLSKLRAGQAGAQLLIWGSRKALAWEPVSSFKEGEKNIQLVDETKFVGTIVGPDGKPLDGAKLQLQGFSNRTKSVSGGLDAPGDVRLFTSDLEFETIAVDGQFSISNMPADYRAFFSCVGQRGERKFILIDTGDNIFKTVKYRGGGVGKQDVLRSPAKVTLEQKPWVEIQVVDHNGKPVSGGGIEAITKDRHHGGSVPIDKNGTGKLIVSDSGKHEVRYTSDPLFPAIGVSRQIDISATGSSKVTLKLPKPIFIEGRVVDSETGAPVVGAYVWAGSGNQNYDLKSSDRRITGALVVSGKDGVFRMPVIAGEQRMYVSHEIDGYVVASDGKGVPASVKDDGTTEDDVVIKIGQGLRIQGVVTDDNGQPVVGAKVTAAEEERNYRKTSTVTDALGQYEIAGMSPSTKKRISTWSDTGAAHAFLKGDPEHRIEESVTKNVDLKIKAGTTLTGRVVQDGKPMAGVTVKLKNAPPQPPEQDWIRFYFLSESVTDSDGRYRVSGLHKGESYQVEILPTENAEALDWQYSGGYSHEMLKEDGSTVELPDAVLLTHGQSLSGIVVDLEGKPVTGYSVSASLAGARSGPSLRRPQKGPPPWTKTNEDGRFELTYLPDKPLKLTAYKSNPKGGRIHYPTSQEVKLNDQEIRIVVDPTLGGGIEDLD